MVLMVHVYFAQETWYALVANANFMFNDVQNEALAEQLREKKRFYGEQVRRRHPVGPQCLAPLRNARIILIMCALQSNTTTNNEI